LELCGRMDTATNDYTNNNLNQIKGVNSTKFGLSKIENKFNISIGGTKLKTPRDILQQQLSISSRGSPEVSI
jgi:hypothetical protein